MTATAIRTVAASAVLYVAFASFVAYAACGVYLDLKLGEYCDNVPPPKAERWNPARYAPGVEPWLARDRRWHRWRNVVWLGCAVGGGALHWLLHP